MLRYVDLPQSGLRARLRGLEAPGPRAAAVFLHGLGCAASSWPLRQPLPEGIGAVYLDLPGHGAARRAFPERFEGLAEAVSVAVDELCLERVILVGHSMGGLVALHAEAVIWSRLQKTVLFCVGSRFANVRPMLETLRADKDAPVSRSSVGSIAASQRSEARIRRAVAGMRRVGRETMIRGLALLEPYDAVDCLPRLPPVPRCLAYGTCDPMVPESEALRLANVAPAETVRLTGVGHYPMVETPSVFRRLLYDALDGARCGRDRPEPRRTETGAESQEAEA